MNDDRLFHHATPQNIFSLKLRLVWYTEKTFSLHITQPIVPPAFRNTRTERPRQLQPCLIIYNEPATAGHATQRMHTRRRNTLSLGVE